MPVGYGKTIREAFSAARSKSKRRYRCPKCSRTAIKRAAPGIWECRKCGAKFASGSYEFKA